MNFFNLLLSGATDPVADWISSSFPIIQTVLIVLISLCAVAVIVAVLLSSSNPDGGQNVITGTNDSYYRSNKGGNKEGRLKKVIVICGIVIFCLTVLYFISFGIYTGFSG